MVMETEKSQNLQSASCIRRRADAQFQFESRGLRTELMM